MPMPHLMLSLTDALACVSSSRTEVSFGTRDQMIHMEQHCVMITQGARLNIDVLT